MFNMFRNKILSNPAVTKGAKDACVHFATGVTAGYLGHIRGKKFAEALSNDKAESDVFKNDRKLK